MRGYISVLLITFCLLFASCANRDTGPAQHATVVMRDGSQLTGTVTSSSASEVTLRGDDNTTHALAMKDVKSIEYDDTSAPESQPPQTAQAPAQRGARRLRERGHEDHYHPEQAAITTRTYELQVGTELPVRAEETIDSGQAAEGQTYAAEVTQDVLDANSDVVIPRGANAQIVIRSSSKGGRFRGSSDLVLDLASVSVGGRRYQLSTADLVQRGKAGMGGNRRTAEYTGGGGAIGAIIGAIAGGGKGAALGAASGAGAGAITQIVTKGGSIKVPAETVLTFKLDRPLRVVAAQ
jgi:hypothetical protein